MANVLKSENLKLEKAVATIKLYNDAYSDMDYNKALVVLLGGYNKYGRKMDINKFDKLKKHFDNLIQKVSEEIQ